MIVKDIARSKPKVTQTMSAGAAQRATTRAIVDILRYVTADDLGLERIIAPDSAEEQEKDQATEEERRYEQALTDYLLAEKPNSYGRVGGRAAFWSDDEEVDAEEFLERSLFAMTNVDPSHFRHHVLSERHADVDLVSRARGGHGKDRPWGRGVTVEELMRALRDLYGSRAAILIAEHIDTDHRHFHVIVVTVDPTTGRGFQTNGGFNQEALHALAARIDYETGAQSEPNALYVADKTGIYDRWTGSRVADLNLQIDAKANQDVRQKRRTLMAQNDALDQVAGWQRRVEEALELEQPLPAPPAWDDQRIAQIMARARITSAGSWAELHRGLASIGITYVPAGGGGRLVFGDESQIAATAAASTASLAHLTRRLGPFKPAGDDIEVRPFVRPTYTMNKSFELERQHRKIARLEAKAERQKIKAKRKAAEAAIAVEEEIEDEARRDALRRLHQASQAALEDWQPPRKPHDRRPRSRPITACEEAIIWSAETARLDRLVALHQGYARRVDYGMIAWWRDGQPEIYEHRRHLSIRPKADKRQVLRLAHYKWGDNFEIICSRRELHEYTRIAATEGIYFGDAEQRARIRAEQDAQLAKVKLGDRLIEAEYRAARAAKLAVERLKQRQATIAQLLRHLADARDRRREKEKFERRFGQAAVEEARQRFQPSNQRAMKALTAIKDKVRSELIDLRQRRPGASSPALVDATREWPRDIHSPSLRVRLAAEAFRQEAERDILLRWRATGRLKTAWDDKLVTKPKEDWAAAAWERELRNPEFLYAINARREPEHLSDDPDVAALILAARTNADGYDMAAVRAELTATVRRRYGVNVSGRAYAQLLRGLGAAEQKVVRQCLTDDGNRKGQSFGSNASRRNLAARPRGRNRRL